MWSSDLFLGVPRCKSQCDSIHSLFLNCNDEGREKTLQTCAKYPVHEKATTALITSGFFGLTLANRRGTNSESQVKVRYVISIDNGNPTRIFWQEVSRLLQMSSSRKEFIVAVEDVLIKRVEEFYLLQSPRINGIKLKDELRIFNEEIAQQKHLLSSDEGYLWAKALFAEKRFIHLDADLCDPKVTQAVATALKSIGQAFDTIFLTNVADYALLEGRLDSYHCALEKLKSAASDDTLVVDSAHTPLTIKQLSCPPQRVRKKFVATAIRSAFIPSPIQFLYFFKEPLLLSSQPSFFRSKLSEEIKEGSGKLLALDARKKKVEERKSTLLYFGDFFALNLVWERGRDVKGHGKIDRLICVNGNQDDCSFWNTVEEMIKVSEKKEEFLTNFAKRIQYQTGEAIFKRIETEQAQDIGWLASEEAYQYVRAIFLKCNCAFLMIDIFNPSQLASLIEAIKKTCCGIDTLYLFNAPHEASERSLQPLFNSALSQFKGLRPSHVVTIQPSSEGAFYDFREGIKLAEITAPKKTLLSSFQMEFFSVPLSSGRNEPLLLTPFEENAEAVLDTLEKIPVKQHAPAVLFNGGGFYPLDFVAFRGSGIENGFPLTHLVCVSESLTEELFWEKFSALIRLSTSRLEFAAWVPALLDTLDLELHGKELPETQVNFIKYFERFQKQLTFLNEDTTYLLIKEIFLEQRFVFLRADPLLPITFSSISQGLKKLKLKLDTIYLSDLQITAEKQDRMTQFQSALKELQPCITPATFVIHSVFTQNHYTQQLTQNFNAAVPFPKSSYSKETPTKFDFYQSNETK